MKSHLKVSLSLSLSVFTNLIGGDFRIIDREKIWPSGFNVKPW